MVSGVYFVHDPRHGLVKVGWAIDLNRRIQRLKSDLRLESLDSIYFIESNQCISLESKIHFWLDRAFGLASSHPQWHPGWTEWFIDGPVIRNFIAKKPSQYDYALVFAEVLTGKGFR